MIFVLTASQQRQLMELSREGLRTVRTAVKQYCIAIAFGFSPTPSCSVWRVASKHVQLLWRVPSLHAQVRQTAAAFFHTRVALPAPSDFCILVRDLISRRQTFFLSPRTHCSVHHQGGSSVQLYWRADQHCVGWPVLVDVATTRDRTIGLTLAKCFHTVVTNRDLRR
jgi:hypothetical protein